MAHIMSQHPSTLLEKPTKHPSTNRTQLMEGCWSPEEIERSLKYLTKELEDNQQMSTSKKKRLKNRVHTLKKALDGKLLVGGQITKKLTTSKKHKKSKTDTLKKSENKFIELSKIPKKLHKSIKCLRCRRGGHRMSDCPLNAIDIDNYKKSVTEISNTTQKFCFNCGKDDHTLKNCKEIRAKDGTLPFVTCFICNNKGHLASHCPHNSKGMYPNGGGCRICGSVYHKQADCPEKQKSNQATNKKTPIDRTKKQPKTSNSNDPDEYWQMKF